MAIDLELAHERQDEVRFGRNRLFAALGGALTAAAVKTFGPADEAHAGPGPILYPYICFGAGICGCCNAAGICCGANCKPSLGCTGVTTCWFACDEVTNDLYQCCDFTWNNDLTHTSCMCQKMLVRNGCADPA